MIWSVPSCGLQVATTQLLVLQRCTLHCEESKIKPKKSFHCINDQNYHKACKCQYLNSFSVFRPACVLTRYPLLKACSRKTMQTIPTLTLEMRVRSRWARLTGKVSGVALSKQDCSAWMPLLSHMKQTLRNKAIGASGSCNTGCRRLALVTKWQVLAICSHKIINHHPCNTSCNPHPPPSNSGDPEERPP